MTEKDRPEQTDKTSGGYTVTYDPAAAHEAGYKLGFEDGRRTATQEGQEPPDLGQPSVTPAGNELLLGGWLSGEVLTDKTDVIMSDGTHRYWSTWCRHGNHEACSADFIEGESAFVGDVRRVLVKRRPACCKTCGAPCVCTECDHSIPDPSAEGGNHG